MQKIKATGCVAALFLLAAPVIAAPAGQVGASERAEHEQWEKDTQRWVAEHESVAKTLTQLIADLRSAEHALAAYDADIRKHAERLRRGDEAGELLAAHMEMRSAHEEMRIAHARLLVALSEMQGAVHSDDDTGTTAPVPKPAK